MKRAKSILLSLSFIGMAMMLNLDMCCEFQKIPNLVKHYSEHKEYDGDSFWQFLVEDYIDHDADEHHSNSEKSHDDLPFHGSHQCQHSTVLFSTNITYSIEPFSNDFLVSKGFYQFRFSSPFLEAPLQPPQA